MGELFHMTHHMIERIYEDKRRRGKKEEKKQENPTKKAVIPMITKDEIKERL